MLGSPQSASSSPTQDPDRTHLSRQPADFVYQSVTVVAMLLILGSLWVF